MTDLDWLLQAQHDTCGVAEDALSRAMMAESEAVHGFYLALSMEKAMQADALGRIYDCLVKQGI